MKKTFIILVVVAIILAVVYFLNDRDTREQDVIIGTGDTTIIGTGTVVETGADFDIDTEQDTSSTSIEWDVEADNLDEEFLMELEARREAQVSGETLTEEDLALIESIIEQISNSVE